MPPKRAKEQPSSNAHEAKTDSSQAEDSKTNNTRTEASKDHSRKRKTPPTSTPNGSSKPPPQKLSRTSRWNKPTTTSSDTSSIITFLLSPDSLPLCYPDDELSSPSSHITYSRTPPQTLSPFIHLLCASLLSKPLSHRLGLRSIRTLLNAPYNFTSADAIVSAGETRVWEALEEARTQHRQKSATQAFNMARTIQNEGGEEKWFANALDSSADMTDQTDQIDQITHHLSKVKGIAKTATSIFLRRIQLQSPCTETVFPYADEKSLSAVNECGIKTSSAEELWSLVQESETGLHGDIGDLDSDDEEKEKEKKKKVAFVLVLERCLGAVLEGNGDQIRDRS